MKTADAPAPVQPEQPKNEQSKTDGPQVEQPKPDAPKAVPHPEPKPVKPGMNLEETLKLVADSTPGKRYVCNNWQKLSRHHTARLTH